MLTLACTCARTRALNQSLLARSTTSSPQMKKARPEMFRKPPKKKPSLAEIRGWRTRVDRAAQAFENRMQRQEKIDLELPKRGEPKYPVIRRHAAKKRTKVDFMMGPNGILLKSPTSRHNEGGSEEDTYVFKFGGASSQQRERPGQVGTHAQGCKCANTS